MKKLLVLPLLLGFTSPVYANDPSKATHICLKHEWELSSEQALKQLGLKTKQYDGSEVPARYRVVMYCENMKNY